VNTEKHKLFTFAELIKRKKGLILLPLRIKRTVLRRKKQEKRGKTDVKKSRDTKEKLFVPTSWGAQGTNRATSPPREDHWGLIGEARNGPERQIDHQP